METERAIAIELSYLVFLKQQQERDAKEGRITAPVHVSAYPSTPLFTEKPAGRSK